MFYIVMMVISVVVVYVDYRFNLRSGSDGR